MPAKFQDRHWPLLVIVYPARMDPDGLRAFYVTWSTYLRRGPHAALLDLRAADGSTWTATMRRLAADEVEARRTLYEQNLVAEARCVQGALARHLLTAFDWIKGNSFKRPARNFDDIIEAELWVEGELRKARLPVPLHTPP